MQNTIPTGCLSTDLLIKSYPQDRERLVKHAVEERRRQLATYAELRGLIGFQPIHTTKIVLVSGLVSFVLAFLLAQFSQLADWYKKVTDLKVAIPVPALGAKTIDIGSRVPTSTTFELLSALPAWTLKECLWFAIAVMLVTLFVQAVRIIIHWRDAMRLKQGEQELQKELTYLESL